MLNDKISDYFDEYIRLTFAPKNDIKVMLLNHEAKGRAVDAVKKHFFFMLKQKKLIVKHEQIKSLVYDFARTYCLQVLQLKSRQAKTKMPELDKLDSSFKRKAELNEKLNAELPDGVIEVERK